MSEPTVPVFSPDGTLGDVPYSRLHDAIAAGGKMGVNISDPQGNPGVIPADRTQDAIKAGARVVPYDLSQQQQGPGVIRTAANDLTASFTNRAPGESIQQQVAGGVMGDRGAQAVAQQQQQDISSGNVRGMYGHLAATETPAVIGAVQLTGAPRAVADAVSSKVGELVPSIERAQAGFKDVMGAARNNTVDFQNSQDSILKMVDWQKKTQLGPTINKFLNRVTSPKQGPLTYEEGRDFYQLLGKLSADEGSKLPPAVRFDLTRMVTGLKQDIGNSAAAAGKGAEYTQAMTEYHQAKQVQNWIQAGKDLGIDVMKYGIGGGLAGLAFKKGLDLTQK